MANLIPVNRQEWVDPFERELMDAIVGGQMRVQYQPQVCMVTGATVGAEALVRWEHPRDGLLEPEAFLATAERTDLIDAIDTHVLRVACDHLSRLGRRPRD